MLDIECDKCKGVAHLDTRLTIKDYTDNLEILVKDEGELTNIPNYIYYNCHNCETSFKYTVEEILNKYKAKMAKDAIYIRYTNNNRSLYGKKIEQDSGLVYCGRCFGTDGTGHCFKDSYNACKMRR